jgi:cytochrome c peroxidase
MMGTNRTLFGAVTVLFLSTAALRTVAGEETTFTSFFFENDDGVSETVTSAVELDTTNPFFQSLGSNDRACVSCHQPAEGWTVTPANVRRRFLASDGFDPIFRLNDAANCSTADVSSLDARRRAYDLLLRKGLIRVALPIPPNAEFSLVEVDDPYQCTGAELAMFRRPLPTTNLTFLSAVMWDGRETRPGATMEDNLHQQAIDATLGHAQAPVAPTADQVRQIVEFETRLFTTQVRDVDAGRLDANGAVGGAVALSQQAFFIGINDPIGLNPTGALFDPLAFALFNAWLQPGRSSDGGGEPRRSIARGQELFNTRPIAISGVAGLNDALGLPEIAGTCTTCHDTPNVGNHSVAMALNIGVSAEANRTADLPLYTLSCNTTGEIIKTTDPGRAMITGKCADIGKVKGPILRGLAARPPYFHNGSAATLADVVAFYDRRFMLHLNARERADLVAFLRVL